ncbi:K7_Yhr159wbp, partial [Saccharomyces cerevisiae Kyokai no. 7]
TDESGHRTREKKSKRSSNKLSFIGEPDNDNSSVKNSVEMTDF